MIAIINRALGISLLISLVGCGVRGPLILPIIPTVPPAPIAPEPKGILYPPQAPEAAQTPASNDK
jgi:predicted small lipoprotein YifL